MTAASVLRLFFIVRLWYFKTDDAHYSLGYTLNTVEVNLAIVTATIPALWPLARLWFPSVFESMGINRPYLYPDIEVGYVEHASPRTASSPALRGKILWLQRPRPPSCVRPVAEDGGPAAGAGGGGFGLGLTDIRGQRVVVGATAGGRSRSAHEEDGPLDDYHEMIRRAEVELEQHECDSLADHKQLPSEAATSSSSDARR